VRKKSATGITDVRFKSHPTNFISGHLSSLVEAESPVAFGGGIDNDYLPLGLLGSLGFASPLLLFWLQSEVQAPKRPRLCAPLVCCDGGRFPDVVRFLRGIRRADLTREIPGGSAARFRRDDISKSVPVSKWDREVQSRPDLLSWIFPLPGGGGESQGGTSAQGYANLGKVRQASRWALAQAQARPCSGRQANLPEGASERGSSFQPWSAKTPASNRIWIMPLRLCRPNQGERHLGRPANVAQQKRFVHTPAADRWVATGPASESKQSPCCAPRIDREYARCGPPWRRIGDSLIKVAALVDQGLPQPLTTIVPPEIRFGFRVCWFTSN